MANPVFTEYCPYEEYNKREDRIKCYLHNQPCDIKPKTECPYHRAILKYLITGRRNAKSLSQIAGG